MKLTIVNSIPSCCIDGCKKKGEYDAKSISGPWGDFCEEHFKRYCIGLGTGLGQRRVLRAELARG